MFVKRNTCLLVFLLCSLTLWCKSTSAGSSFLSPSQKPQEEHLTHHMGGTEACTDSEIIVGTDCIDFIQDLGINKGKPPRVGRQVMEEPSQPAVDNHLTIRPLFDIGFTVREEDFEQYGVVLQIIRRLLGSTEAPTESPSQL